MEVLIHIALVALVGVRVLAGVVIAFGGACVQGVEIHVAANRRVRLTVGEGAFQGQTETVHEADVAVLPIAAERAFELRVLGHCGVAGVLAFALADIHARVGGRGKALRGGLRAGA